jgi:hypothetical protein
MHLNETASTLAYCIGSFQSALDSLRIRYTPEQLESWMLGIFYAMTGRSRNFHQLDHVLDVGRGLQPLQVIAALYHDVVYFQVDQGFTPFVQQRIKDVLETRDHRFYVTAETRDPKLRLVRDMFEFVPGQEVSVFSAMNEFLSSMVAIHDLGAYLTDIQVAAIAACIRATVPFQGPDASGKTFPVRIGSTLERISGREKWNLTSAAIDDLVRLAVEMGNSDVASFGNDDLSVFLDNTWKLLPEANPALFSVGAYTVKSYRMSLQKMEGFMSQLDAELVFHEYRGYPDEPSYRSMKEAAAKNVKQAIEYLQAKLVTMAVLEGIAELTGGDAPIVLLAGASKEEEPSAMQIQGFLKEPRSYRLDNFSGINEAVYHVLNVGRNSATHFDSKASPLAAVIYSVLGREALRSCFESAGRAFKSNGSWLEFLRSFPRSLMKEIVEAVATISVVRKDRCRQLATRLEGGES